MHLGSGNLLHFSNRMASNSRFRVSNAKWNPPQSVVISVNMEEDTTVPPAVSSPPDSPITFTIGQSGVGGGNWNMGYNYAEEYDMDEYSPRRDSTMSDRSLPDQQETLEKVPKVDHYRIHLADQDTSMPTRPTLLELHAAGLRNTSTGSFGELTLDGKPGYERLSEPDEVPDKKKTKADQGPAKLDWVQGVLMRCVLNILGVMLYLRLSWVAGQAGIGLGSVIVLLATVVTVLTALSMCAIATNGEVKGGGVYFLISRSLGPEFGGSIGVIFTLANAVGGAMYIVGFSETVIDLMKRNNACIVDCGQNDIRIVSWATACLILGIIIMGVSFETKAQVVLLFILIISLFSYFIGTVLPVTDFQRSRGVTGYSKSTFLENFTPNWRGVGFFDVFGVYFPAATGIMAGANISGDLKDAQKDIPRGTLLAILLTTILYVLCVWTTGSTCLRDATGEIEDIYNGTLYNCTQRNSTTCAYGLMNYFQIMELESAVGPLVTAGIFAATLSSALASLVSAPKIFQALGRDHLYPYIDYFAQGFGKNDEPRRGYLLFFAICMAVIALGDLNIIAPYISNFFLASYCLVNYACFDASFSESPGFRPSFRFYNMWLSLVGAILCIAVMFVINWITALVTFVFIAILYVYILRSKPNVNWGSSNQATAYRNALQQMLKLQAVPEHVKTYRPQILLLSGNPAERPALVDFATNITKDIALLICGDIILPNDANPCTMPTEAVCQQTLQWLSKRKVSAFYYPIVSSDLSQGSQALMQLCGMSHLRPNIILLGYKNDWRRCHASEIQEYFHIIHHAFDFNLGIGILRVKGGFNISKSLNQLFMPRESEIQYISHNKIDQVRVLESPVSTLEKGSTLKPPSTGFITSHSAPDLRKTTEISLQVLKNAKKPGYPQRLRQFVHKKRKFGDPTPKAAKYEQLVANMDRFRIREKKDPVIDVYWLFDDGGLSMLVPYLLTVPKSYLEGAKLRIFTVATSKKTIDQEQLSMINLLRKFRINFADVTVIPSIRRRPQQSSIRDFQDIIEPVMVHNRQDETTPKNVFITEDELLSMELRTFRQLRIREALLEYSRQSSLIVVTLPVPRKGGISACLYMAWLEALTRGLPPVLLLRGNQQAVLTFYS